MAADSWGNWGAQTKPMQLPGQGNWMAGSTQQTKPMAWGGGFNSQTDVNSGMMPQLAPPTSSAYDQNHGAGAFANNTAQNAAFENGATWQADGTYGTGMARMTADQMEAGRRAQTYGGYSTGSGYGQQPTAPDGYAAPGLPGTSQTRPMQLPGTAGGMGGAVSGGVPGSLADMGGQAGGMGGGQGNWMTGGNPYLSQMADEIQRRSQQDYGRKAQGIRSNMVGSGNLGGSRQGVAEAEAIGQSQDSLQGNLSALYSGQYNQDANRGLQQYGMDQNYDVNKENARNNFYTSQRGQDLTQFGIGVDAYGKGMDGPWGPIKDANSVYATYAKNAQDAGANKSNWQSILGTGMQALSFAKGMGWL